MVEGAVYPDLVKTLLRNKGRNAVFRSYTRIHHQDLEKFEIEVPWQSMEEHVALQLWDVYRALYTF